MPRQQILGMAGDGCVEGHSGQVAGERHRRAKSPDKKPRLNAQGFEVVVNTPEQLTAFFIGKMARWKAVEDTTEIKQN